MSKTKSTPGWVHHCPERDRDVWWPKGQVCLWCHVDAEGEVHAPVGREPWIY